MDWTNYYKTLCDAVASKSKDPKIKVGCILVDRERHLIISQGMNGAPHGYPDEKINWLNRDFNDENSMRFQIIHSEANAIYNSHVNLKTYNGVIDAYCNLAPCIECCKALIQCGVKAIYYWIDYKGSIQAKRMADDCGIIYQKLE